MKRLFQVLILLLPLLWPLACSTNNSPTTPGNTNPPANTSTPTGSMTLTPTETWPCPVLNQFGQITLGTLANGAPNAVYAMHVTVSNNAMPFRLNVYMGGAAGNIRTALYSDGGAHPATLISESSSQVAVNGWNTLDISPVTIPPGTYWLALQESVTMQSSFVTLANAAVAAPLAYGAFPSSFPGTFITLNGQASFYADYCMGSPIPTPSFTFTPTPTNTPVPASSLTSTPTLPCPTAYQFGKTALGAGLASGAPGATYAMHVSNPDNAVPLRMNIYLQSAAGLIDTAIYDDAGGRPGNLLSRSATQTAVNGWNSLDIPPFYATPGTYWLAFQESVSLQGSFDGVSGAAVVTASSFGVFPSTFPSTGYVTYPAQASFYVDYCLMSQYPTFTPTLTPTLTNTPLPTDTPYCASPLTLGETNTGGIPYYNRQSVLACGVTMPGDGKVLKLGVYLQNASDPVLRMALYDSDLSNAPGNLLGEAELDNPVPGWNTVEIADIAVTAGLYFVAAQGDDDYIQASGYNSYEFLQSNGPFPSSLAGSGGLSDHLAMVAYFCQTQGAATFTPTFTPSPVDTATFTETDTPLPTDSFTPTPPDTDTPTETFTETDTPTETDSPTDTFTFTPTDTPTPPELIISEVRSRGLAGAADEFVELYNPNSTTSLLDANWTLQFRSTLGVSYSVIWTGGTTVPVSAHAHYLITGAAYSQLPPGDSTLATGITDAGSLVLYHNSTAVDVLDFAFDSGGMTTLTGGGYLTAGSPSFNPHDNTNSSNIDASLERKPGGASGNQTNTGDNASNFQATAPAYPENVTSAPVP